MCNKNCLTKIKSLLDIDIIMKLIINSNINNIVNT